MPKPKKKTEVLFVRVDFELANRLRELAADDGRAISNYIGQVLKKYVAGIDQKEQSQ